MAINTPKPISRDERYLSKIGGNEEVIVPKPVSREEKYMYRAAGYNDQPIPDYPIGRNEKYWAKIIENGGGSGNGSTVTFDSGQKFISDNSSLKDYKIYGNGGEIHPTGALPLTFTTSETALRSYTIYGNNYEHKYSTSGTLPLTFTIHTAGAADDWTIYGNDEGIGEQTIVQFTEWENGSTYTGPAQIGHPYSDCKTNTALTTRRRSVDIVPVTDGTVTLNVTSGYQAADIHFDKDGLYIGNAVAYHNDGYVTTLSSAVKYVAFVIKKSDGSAFTDGDSWNVSIEYSGDKAYKIPLIVSQTGQTDKTYDIYIGDSPLTEGETVSKQSTGIDLELFEGENTISTTLYNKPETSITYTDYLGVGEYVNGQWQIPLAVTCNRNLFNIYGNMAHSGGVHSIDFNVETSSVTGEMPADSFYQLGFQNAIVKGDETFVISFDKTTAGMAELRIVKGEGSRAEIIKTFDISAIKSYRVVFECEESFGNVYPRLVATEAATQTFEHLMIKKASDKGGFVPYGAKYEYNVPIDAPLTDGQSVTDTLTINTFEGENTVSTTLYNKPTMEIETSYGVGMKDNNHYIIPFKVNTTIYNIQIGDSPLYDGEYLSYKEKKLYKYIDSVLTPIDPPSPFPEISTTEGVNKVIIETSTQPDSIFITTQNPIKLVQPNIGTKTITQNGIYNASDDNLDGYSSVTVNTN